MKKKILFLVSDMESGGFQKSLISLLQCFYYKKYDIDLLILEYDGSKIKLNSFIKSLSTSTPSILYFSFCNALYTVTKTNIPKPNKANHKIGLL